MSGNVFHRAKVSAVAAIALCGLLAPAKSYAQTDQTMVLVCSNEYPGHEIFTLDLTAKTVSEEEITPNPGGSPDPVDWTFQGTINEITDSEIVMVITANQVQISLNRYTGNMSWQFLNAAEEAAALRVHAATGASCHKQQKQF